MRDAGVELIASYDEMSVMGFVEVIRHLPRHLDLLNDLRSRIARGRVSLVILVDYPGFNMKVARAAARSEEHTSELQSPCNLVCRLLLEKKKESSATSTSSHAEA